MLVRPEQGRWIGPLGRSVTMALLSPAVSQKMTFFLAQQNKADPAPHELTDAGEIQFTRRYLDRPGVCG